MTTSLYRATKARCHARIMALAVSMGLLVGSSPSPHTLAQAPAGTSPCQARPISAAAPEVLLLGETTTVHLQVGVTCPPESNALHIAFALDASGSMRFFDKSRIMKDAVKKVIDGLDLPTNTLTKVAIVEFNTAANTLCDLSRDVADLKSCVTRVRAQGGTAIDRGINVAMQALLRGRTGVNRSGLREVMVVVSDGENNDGCNPVLTESTNAKRQGITMVTVCAGLDCDASCLRLAASSSAYFFHARISSDLVTIFDQIQDQLLTLKVREVGVRAKAADSVAYLDGSADPDPDQQETDGTLTWQTGALTSEAFSINLTLRPSRPGYQAILGLASGSLVDNQNRTLDYQFDLPRVTVLDPRLVVPSTPTPTATPTATASPSPMPSATPTSSPSPTPTPTKRPRPRLFLPLVLRERCTDTTVYADVALVIDMSTSMDRLTRGGRTKRELALEAARGFVHDNLRLVGQTSGRDQVTIVGFNGTAWVEQSLTGSTRLIDAALDRLPLRQAEGTRLDLAFTRGAEALNGPLRRRGNTPTLILLTDGLPSGVPFGTGETQERTVLAAASTAKAKGVKVFTIGLGSPDAPDVLDRVDAALLGAAASEPDMFFLEPEADQLKGVYRQIAYRLACRSVWSRR